MVTDLKLKGTSETLKTGTKSKPIRLVEGDHEIDCRMNGLSIALKACYVKKVAK
jgi:protein PhnA